MKQVFLKKCGAQNILKNAFLKNSKLLFFLKKYNFNPQNKTKSQKDVVSSKNLPIFYVFFKINRFEMKQKFLCAYIWNHPNINLNKNLNLQNVSGTTRPPGLAYNII